MVERIKGTACLPTTYYDICNWVKSRAVTFPRYLAVTGRDVCPAASFAVGSP